MKAPIPQDKDDHKWEIWLGNRLSTVFAALHDAGVSYKDISKYFDNFNPIYVYNIRRYSQKRWNSISLKREVKDMVGSDCSFCGVKPDGSGNIHFHHKGDPKDHSPQNMLPLCRSCHKKLHARCYNPQ